MGLLIIVLLAIGTILLIRNMNARLRRLPESFDDPPEPPHRTDARRGDSETEPPSAATSGGNTASTDD